MLIGRRLEACTAGFRPRLGGGARFRSPEWREKRTCAARAAWEGRKVPSPSRFAGPFLVCFAARALKVEGNIGFAFGSGPGTEDFLPCGGKYPLTCGVSHANCTPLNGMTKGMTQSSPLPSLADRFTISLEEMREEMAAQSPRKGPAGALLAAILRLLEALVALLAEFKAGTLPAAVPNRRATCAAGATCAASATSAEATTRELAARAAPGAARFCIAAVGRAQPREFAAPIVAVPYRQDRGCWCRRGRFAGAGAASAREGLLPLARSGGWAAKPTDRGRGPFRDWRLRACTQRWISGLRGPFSKNRGSRARAVV